MRIFDTAGGSVHDGPRRLPAGCILLLDYYYTTCLLCYFQVGGHPVPPSLSTLSRYLPLLYLTISISVYTVHVSVFPARPEGAVRAGRRGAYTYIPFIDTAPINSTRHIHLVPSITKLTPPLSLPTSSRSTRRRCPNW